MKYFRSLQILRGVAAVAVMLCHVYSFLPVVVGGMITGAGGTPTLFRFIPAGEFSMGAHFFFVLSGFLMAYLIDIEYKNFLLRRIVRIYPAFIIAVLLRVWTQAIFEGYAIPSDLWKTLSLLPLQRIPAPLGIEWTLIYEIFFYFVCALFTLKPLRPWFSIFLIFWATIIILAYQVDTVRENLNLANGTLMLPSWKWIFLSPKNLLFIGGGVGYCFLFKFIPKPNKFFLFVCILTSIIIFRKAYHMGAHSLWGTLIMAVSFLVLIVGIAAREKDSAQQGLSPNSGVRFCEKLGDYSYALYLVHISVILSVIKATNFFWISEDLSLMLQGVLVMAAALICGWYYGKVDVWIHRFYQKKFSGFKTTVSQNISVLNPTTTD